ncbi:MAG: hypothetical protein WC799_25505 [Desulfobacteraceae bacterium]|jgi:hypothetical protein
MGMNYHLAAAAALAIMISGCTAKTWEIRQLETTFVNQTDNREYVQKNAVLLNGETGESWVFSSDENSHYHWEKVPVKSK